MGVNEYWDSNGRVIDLFNLCIDLSGKVLRLYEFIFK